MSKFEEMCETVVACDRRWNEHCERCFANMKRLVDGFIKYCEIPAACNCFLPLDKEPENGMIYSLPGAMHFNNDDGYWHLGLCITLSKRLDILPRQRVLIALCLTEHEGRVMVKRSPEDRSQRLDLGDEGQCKDFDGIVEHVKQFFAGSPQEFLDSSSSPKRIGFHSGTR